MIVELDPRVARTRNVVMAATTELLAEVGFERICIDAIAERSGVARSTIYRNWPDRATLLAEAFRQLCPKTPADIEPSGTLGGDLEALAALLVTQLTSDDWSHSVPSLIGAAIHDPSIRSLTSSFSRERREQARKILERAAERGEIGRPGEIDSALERFVGPFFFRRLMSHEPLDDAFVTAQVTATLEQLAVEPTRKKKRRR